ncbi:MAG: prepilin-type N-terminal cleavage/methylation domain-containing protein [Candidatus Omnitrophica bacterium]|nr:prepilin-type N-terminal cleavage/methylation domain-containing protein [Candidatus Omnitrophota bacterium]
MNRKGFTLVEIMIVVAIIALLAAIAVPNLLSARRTANEAAAKATVRSLSTAAETFSTSHSGAYPTDILGAGNLQDFIASAGSYCANATGTATAVQGYNYACTLTSGGYTFVASPVTPGTTGNVTYTASTGGVLTPL